MNNKHKRKPKHTPSQEGIQRQIKHLVGRIESLQEEQDHVIAELKHLTALQRGENPKILPSKKSRRTEH